MSTTKLDTRRAFLEGLIDYAGLFPPESRDMPGAVQGFLEARAGTSGWVVARFICPASRLKELAEVMTSSDTGEPWPLSIVFDGTGDPWAAAVAADVERSSSFVEATGAAAVLTAAELRMPERLGGEPLDEVAAAVIEVLRAMAPLDLMSFFEVPFGPAWPDSVPRLLEGLVKARDATGRQVGAKIRCGGAAPEAFPSTEQVAAFIGDCRDLGLAFKATAGLHHPFRHEDPALGVVRHGFVNVAGAAVLAHAAGINPVVIEAAVADRSPQAFSLTAEGLSWRELTATAAQVEEARSRLFAGYGSCSFTEPIADLTDLAVLPLEP